MMTLKTTGAVERERERERERVYNLIDRKNARKVYYF